jgi:hypothetical protein
LNEKVIFGLFGFKPDPTDKIKGIEKRVELLQAEHSQKKDMLERIPIRFKIMDAL